MAAHRDSGSNQWNICLFGKLDGETEMRVLALPTSEGAITPQGLSLSPSACLFTNRAQMVTPDFQITDRNAALIAELCDRLEGIPLALEIAASRIKSLSLSQMRNELAHRLDFLQSSSKRLPARHQTLRAALDWSYALQEEAEPLLQAALALRRETGKPGLIARCLVGLGAVEI